MTVTWMQKFVTGTKEWIQHIEIMNEHQIIYLSIYLSIWKNKEEGNRRSCDWMMRFKR